MKKQMVDNFKVWLGGLERVLVMNDSVTMFTYSGTNNRG